MSQLLKRWLPVAILPMLMAFCGAIFFAAQDAEAQCCRGCRSCRTAPPCYVQFAPAPARQASPQNVKGFWWPFGPSEPEPEPVVPHSREARNEFIASKLGAYCRANHQGVDILQAIGKRRVVWRQSAADQWPAALVAALRQKVARNADGAGVVTIGIPEPDAWAVCTAAGVWLSAIDTETGGLVQLVPRPTPAPEPQPTPADPADDPANETDGAEEPADKPDPLPEPTE